MYRGESTSEKCWADCWWFCRISGCLSNTLSLQDIDVICTGHQWRQPWIALDGLCVEELPMVQEGERWLKRVGHMVNTVTSQWEGPRFSSQVWKRFQHCNMHILPIWVLNSSGYCAPHTIRNMISRVNMWSVWVSSTVVKIWTWFQSAPRRHCFANVASIYFKTSTLGLFKARGCVCEGVNRKVPL